MASSIHIGPLVIQPGNNQTFEITAPSRANGATIKISRFSWPAGALFTYRVLEAERGSGDPQLLTSGTENGGTVIGKNGEIDPPLIIGLKWAADKDRDRIRFEVDVFQAFTTEVFMDFIA